MLKRDKIALEISLFLLFGIITMIAMIMIKGTPSSISQYASYPATAVLFKAWILSMAIGTYRSSTMKGVHIPAIGIAVFDVSNVSALANMLHNISAIWFVVAIMLSIYKQHKPTSVAVLLSVITYPFIGLYMGEILTMLIIYIYFINNSLKLIR